MPAPGEEEAGGRAEVSTGPGSRLNPQLAPPVKGAVVHFWRKELVQTTMKATNNMTEEPPGPSV